MCSSRAQIVTVIARSLPARPRSESTSNQSQLVDKAGLGGSARRGRTSEEAGEGRAELARATSSSGLFPLSSLVVSLRGARVAHPGLQENMPETMAAFPSRSVSRSERETVEEVNRMRVASFCKVALSLFGHGGFIGSFTNKLQDDLETLGPDTGLGREAWTQPVACLLGLRFRCTQARRAPTLLFCGVARGVARKGLTFSLCAFAYRH